MLLIISAILIIKMIHYRKPSLATFFVLFGVAVWHLALNFHFEYREIWIAVAVITIFVGLGIQLVAVLRARRVKESVKD